MKRNLDLKIFSIIVGISFIVFLGIAGNYDRQSEQEDAQIQQELQDESNYNQLMIEHYEDSIYSE